LGCFGLNQSQLLHARQIRSPHDPLLLRLHYCLNFCLCADEPVAGNCVFDGSHFQTVAQTEFPIALQNTEK
jgi:hypothetical protein